MYQTKTPGILEMLMNLLSLPLARRTAAVSRPRRSPRRHDRGLARWTRESTPSTEMYIDAARLSRWNR